MAIADSVETSVRPAAPVREATERQAPMQTKTRGGRYEFLDVLRGVAAMSVVVQHALELVNEHYLRWSVQDFRPGEFGVVVFFMVSGFIIPASLERYDSLVKFWIGRVFRLYPLYWIICAVCVIASVVGSDYQLTQMFHVHPIRAGVVNVTMMQEALHYDSVIGAAWTLSYEMIFYLMVSLLFLAGRHRAAVSNSLIATGSIVVIGFSFGSGLVTNGGVTLSPSVWLHDKGKMMILVVTGLTILYLFNRATTTGRRAAAIVLPIITIPLLFNLPNDLWFSLGLFAYMFAGTVFYRMANGDVRPVTGWLTAALAAGVVCWSFHLWVVPNIGLAGAHVTARPEMLTFGGAFVLFAVAYLMRSRSFPPPLMWLGKISYSLYLVHALLIHVIPPIHSTVLGIPGEAASVIVWVGSTIVTAWLTYTFIEAPFHKLGHKVASKYA